MFAAIAVLSAALASCAPHAAATTTPITVRVVARDGHASTPVWYHDTVGTALGSDAVTAWTTDAGSIQARELSPRTGAWLTTPVTVSTTVLNCHCVDSTGTNPNRHDVPTLVTDRAGRVYAFYGGGTAAQLGDHTGPFLRVAARPGSIRRWLPEQRLPVPGAVYDMQALHDATGADDIIGQQGRNSAGAGSLVSLRLVGGTRTTPAHLDTFGQSYRILVRGGADPHACAWRATPGCDIFVEGNLAAGPVNPHTGQQRLFLIWSWAESSLAGNCGDPAGYCNRGLYAAESLDHGKTWRNLSGTASIDITAGPIPYRDNAFQLIAPSHNVGIFKGLTVSGSYPGTPSIAFQPHADTDQGAIRIGTWTGGKWSTITLDHSRPWNNHLVLRSAANGALYLWTDIAQSGNYADDLAQWIRNPTTGHWHKSYLPVGPNWDLTGISLPSRELLTWRSPASLHRTRVMLADLRL